MIPSVAALQEGRRRFLVGAGWHPSSGGRHVSRRPDRVDLDRHPRRLRHTARLICCDLVEADARVAPRRGPRLRHPPPRRRAGHDATAEADLQPSRSGARPGRLRPGRERQVPPARRDLRTDRGPAGEGAGVHAVSDALRAARLVWHAVRSDFSAELMDDERSSCGGHLSPHIAVSVSHS